MAIQPFFGGEERTKAEVELAGIDLLVSVGRTDWMWKAFMPEGEGMDRDHEVINVSGKNAANISVLDFPATLVVAGWLRFSQRLATKVLRVAKAQWERSLSGGVPKHDPCFLCVS